MALARKKPPHQELILATYLASAASCLYKPQTFSLELSEVRQINPIFSSRSALVHLPKPMIGSNQQRR